MDNGGIIGPTNTVSSGGNKVTVQTSNGNITTQPGTTRANVLVVAGGGGGGDSGAGAGGLVFIESATICAATAYPAVIGGGGMLELMVNLLLELLVMTQLFLV